MRGRPGPSALQPGDNGLRGRHALRKLLLRETCTDARLNNRSRERELGSQASVLFAILVVLHPSLMEVIHFRHTKISFARSSASSISRAGVFCVFLMKTRTTMTRCATAAT